MSAIYLVGVSELADEVDSKSISGNGVWVQVPPPAFCLHTVFKEVMPEALQMRVSGMILLYLESEDITCINIKSQNR